MDFQVYYNLVCCSLLELQVENKKFKNIVKNIHPI